MIEAKIYTAEQIIADIEKQKEALEKSSKAKTIYIINPADKENFEKNNRGCLWPRLYCSRNSSAGKSCCIQRTAFKT